MSENTRYNYVIIGTGAAGLHLALAMHAHPFFADKRILLLDKSAKETNDKTWCYWEKTAGKWDDIVTQKWTKALFASTQKALDLDLAPYTYNMLRSIDFYNYAKAILQKAPNFTWHTAEVISVEENQTVEIKTASASFYAELVFDSRIEQNLTKKSKHNTILQHFKGWMIETPKPFFDTQKFTMMDFRVKWQNSTSFTYVLPTSARTAMVEFTLFTPQLIADEDYEKSLKTYISTQLKISDYKITEVEKGVIPMSDFPFHNASTKRVIKIGTAGSWVKPSSGYSFKNAEKYAARIVQHLAAGKAIPKLLANPKFRMYDAIFLDVLTKKNHLGEDLFTRMYSQNPTPQIFKFLDEETSLAEDIKIMATFPKGIFTATFFKRLLL